MSVAPESDVAPKQRLEDIETHRIAANPANPRLHFPQDELDRLAQSVAKEGILVPLVVYQDGDDFVLVDGERRLKCAQYLGLKQVPAVVVPTPGGRENLIRMFNIHLVREPWQDMPTAWALKNLIAETGVTNDRELSDLTGLSLERITRLRHALELPKDYQDYINGGVIPLNFFWELKRYVIEPLARRRPAVWAQFGEDEVLSAFVAKRLAGVVTTPVSLRKVSQIVTVANREAGSSDAPSALDQTLIDLVRDESMTVDDAYEDTAEMTIEADRLERRMGNLLKGLERLLERARNTAERGEVVRIVREFGERLRGITGG